MPSPPAETEAIGRLQRGVALCLGEGDNGTSDLLESILKGEADHADWLETQLQLIDQLGEAHYLTQQMHS